eukprot:gene8571-9274_t
MRRLSATTTVLSEDKVVKVCQPSITVYSFPDVFSEVVCYLIRNIYVKCLEIYRATGEGGHFTWAKIAAGWIVISDLKNPEAIIVQSIYDPQEAANAWSLEKQKVQQMASAIASTLVRTYSLPQAKRLVRSILKHATTYYPNEKALVKVTSQSMDDIMIILDGIKVGLTKQQIFEYIKASACRQSNPRQAIIDIANQLWQYIQERPTTWVTNHLNIIITEDIRIRNNLFVMSAANGDLLKLRHYIEKEKINLLSLHSELSYTALHAAADFGQYEIMNYLIHELSSSISLDIKDPLRGQTALHFAADSGRASVVQLLINANANREISNNEGYLPFQLANKHGYIETREICKLLPPPVTFFQIIDTRIQQITLSWKLPELNLDVHSEIIEYEIQGRFVEGAVDIPDPPVALTSSVSHTFYNLYPSCVYRFRIRCRSLSGWSDYCNWIFAKTLAHRAEAPLPVEVRKVAINGLVLMWFPPKRDNGHAIDYYQLEIADYHSIHGMISTNANGELIPPITLATNEDDDKDENEENNNIINAPNTTTSSFSLPSGEGREDEEGTINSSRITSSSLSSPQEKKKSLRKKRGESTAAQAKKASLAASQGGVSRYYRLLKHKQLNLLLKYITGLEAHRLYQIRVRAHNELGYSPWSEWSAPVAPHLGVWVEAFLPQENSMEITWFVPMINAPRSIEAYELQLCIIQSQLVVNHAASNKRKVSNPQDLTRPNQEDEDDVNHHHKMGIIKLNDHSKPQHDINEFITITNTITNNRYFVQHLKAGRKYQFRCRAKLKEEDDWPSWEYCSVMSDVIQMSSTIPTAPSNLRPALQHQALVSAAVVSATSVPDEYDLFEEDERIQSMMVGTTSFSTTGITMNSVQINPMNIYPERIVDDYIKDHRIQDELLQNNNLNQNDTKSSTKGNSRNNDGNDPVTHAANSLPNSHDQLPSSSENSIAGLIPAQSDASIANSGVTEYRILQAKIDINSSTGSEETAYDITHNTITLTFANGDANGERIIGYELQMVRIRHYHFQDLLYAKEAFIGIQEDDDDIEEENNVDVKNENHEDHPIKKSYQQRMQENLQKPYSGQASVTSGSTSAAASLSWETIHLEDEEKDEFEQSRDFTTGLETSIYATISRYAVEKIAPQTYKVQNLTPGETYAFRVRTKNKIGWSQFSSATPLIATYPSIPPEQPILLYRQQTVVILMWKDMEGHNKLQQTNSQSMSMSLSRSNTSSALTSPKLKKMASKGIVPEIAPAPTLKAQRTPPQAPPIFAPDDVGGAEMTTMTTLSTLEYELQIRKVTIKQVLPILDTKENKQMDMSRPTTSEKNNKKVILEYLSKWETIHSQIYSYDQLKKQPIFAQFQRMNNTGTFQNGTMSGMMNLSSLLSGSGILDPSILRFVILSNLVEFNWYLMRVRVRTVIGWSPWSPPSDPFRMSK